MADVPAVAATAPLAAAPSAADSAPLALTTQGVQPGGVLPLVLEKAPPAQWNAETEEALIDEWGAEFIRLKQGNLGNRHWKTIAKGVNEKRGELPEYTVKL
jgi:hypothetical protein